MMFIPVDETLAGWRHELDDVLADETLDSPAKKKKLMGLMDEWSKSWHANSRDVDVSTATLFELMHGDKFFRIVEHVEEQAMEVYVADVEYSDDGHDAENGPQTPTQELGDWKMIESSHGVHVDRQHVKQSCLAIIMHALASLEECEGGAI
jgi:hypothetical protein